MMKAVIFTMLTVGSAMSLKAADCGSAKDEDSCVSDPRCMWDGAACADNTALDSYEKTFEAPAEAQADFDDVESACAACMAGHAHRLLGGQCWARETAENSGKFRAAAVTAPELTSLYTADCANQETIARYATKCSFKPLRQSCPDSKTFHENQSGSDNWAKCRAIVDRSESQNVWQYDNGKCYTGQATADECNGKELRANGGIKAAAGCVNRS